MNQNGIFGRIMAWLKSVIMVSVLGAVFGKSAIVLSDMGRGAGSKERGAGSMEQGAWSRERWEKAEKLKS